MNKATFRAWGPWLISLVALFAALVGPAGALQGKNSVDSGDIKPGAVKNSDVAEDAIDYVSLARHAVVTGNIADEAISSDKMGEASVPTQAIRQSAVTGGKLGTILVRSNAGFLNPTPTGLQASCPMGTRMLSGGTETAGDAVLQSRNPDVAETGTGQGQDRDTWRGVAYKKSGTVATMRVYVLCLQ
ncbi:hypothetical protein BH10ACT11_BH10ACT11_01960 [soil metagenome]